MFLRNKFVKMDEADDGAEGKSSGGGDDAAKASAEQIKLLTQSVGLLADGLQKMEGNQASIIDTLARITDQSKGEVKKDLTATFGEDVDLEQLDRKDFARFILESSRQATQESLDKMLASLDNKIQDLGSRFESKNAGEQVERMANDHKDFWEWSSEIKVLLKENPTLTVRRAYSLVRGENPDKAKAMDAKYNPPAPAKKSGSFIGLTPTSSVGTREGTVKMSQKDAANKAFDDVMADLGDTIQNGDLKLA